MFSLRQATVRALSSSTSIVLSTNARTFTSFRIPPSSLLAVPRLSLPKVQRRFASEEAAAQSELEADGATEAQHGDNSIAAAAAAESLESQLSQSEAEAAAASSESAAEEVPRENRRGFASEAAASIAGTAAAVGDSLSEAAGFDRRSAKSASVPLEPTKTVYVGNLFYDVRPEDLRQELSQAGRVVDVKIIMDGQGLSKGFGYVEFDSTESATKAIEQYHQQNFEGRRIIVQYAFTKHRPQSRRDGIGAQYSRPLNAPTKTLFIGNMSFDMSDRDLNDLFREIKNVIDVRVAIDRRTGQPRGFAHADFTDVGSAERAMGELRGKVFSGRALRVDYSVSTGRTPRRSDLEDRSPRQGNEEDADI